MSTSGPDPLSEEHQYQLALRKQAHENRKYYFDEAVVVVKWVIAILSASGVLSGILVAAAKTVSS